MNMNTATKIRVETWSQRLLVLDGFDETTTLIQGTSELDYSTT